MNKLCSPANQVGMLSIASSYEGRKEGIRMNTWDGILYFTFCSDLECGEPVGD